MEIKIVIDDRLVGGVRRIFTRWILLFLLAVILLSVTMNLTADSIDIPFGFEAGAVISSSQMNANFAAVRDELNIHDGMIATLLTPTGAVWGLNDPDIFYNDGSVGIGTNTPTSLLSLYSATGVGIEIGSGDVSVDPYIIFDVANDDAVKLWRDGSSNSLRFNTNGATRMTIEEGGDLGIGTTNPAQKVHVWGGNLFIQGGKLILDESSGWPFEILSEGEKLYVRQYSSVGEIHLENTYNDVMDLHVERNVYAADFITSSDARLKENIAPITGALDRLAAVEGVSFHFLGSDEPRLGLVAQNVMHSVPEAVSVYDKESGYLGVDYQALIPVLIEAVKELRAENELLKERVADLEAR